MCLENFFILQMIPAFIYTVLVTNNCETREHDNNSLIYLSPLYHGNLLALERTRFSECLTSVTLGLIFEKGSALQSSHQI